MNALRWTAVAASDFSQSPVLRRNLATFTTGAYVRIDANGGNIGLKTSGSVPQFGGCIKTSTASRIEVAAGPITGLDLLDLDVSTLPPLSEDGRKGAWLAYLCRFANGSEDHIYLRLRDGYTADMMDGILHALWPVLREDCLKEAVSPEAKAAMNAMVWTVSRKTASAVFVLNAAGQVLHVNASGRDMLEQGDLIKETTAGLVCGTQQQTNVLQKAVRTCLIEGTDNDTDFILFLEAAAGGLGRIPVSMSRYQTSIDAMPLVVVIIPQQPNREHMERLALKMGLTPSEARVAALMQTGLPNRAAAQIAGLKEQTFNTYSKRVLAKLNMGCRAEMAHMLTWQASVGRAS